MTGGGITRRRALVILAAATFAPGAALSRPQQPFEWRGFALGADARLVLWAVDEREARAAIDSCVREIERLEQIFSLYRRGSEISRLNATGRLAGASADLLHLLRLSRGINAVTDGLFDPTIQPLWTFYRDWYAGNPERRPPPEPKIAAVLKRVGMAKVDMAGKSVSLMDGSSLTLNGIAQGYITDRVAAILRRRGWRHVLIDLGEVRALDGKPDGTPWHVAIRETGRSLPLAGGALATSAGSALSFDASGRTSHIISPSTGRSVAHWRAVTVRHPSAAIADALSTALVLAGQREMSMIARRIGGAWVQAVREDGTGVEYGA
ncbi:MAG: FAD:protein FMN transferase [Alphaproteobacteria bacterium]|nr:MAG: FAD:protein FMN transferase [Alphaproteobacteria bacterium]